MRLSVIAALLGAGLGTAFGQSLVPTGVASDSPATAQALGRIEEYLENETALEPRLAALLPLITAREMDLDYEWSVREAAALQAGLEPVVIDVVRRNGDLAALSGDAALAVDFGRQLYRNRHVDSTTFAALVARLGRQGTFDAIMLLAYPAMTGVLRRAGGDSPSAHASSAPLPRVPGVGTPAGRIGEFVALPPRPPLPSDVHEDSYYRFPLLRRQELDARARACPVTESCLRCRRPSGRDAGTVERLPCARGNTRNPRRPASRRDEPRAPGNRASRRMRCRSRRGEPRRRNGRWPGAARTPTAVESV